MCYVILASILQVPQVTCKISLTFQHPPKSTAVEGRFLICSVGRRRPAVYLPDHHYTLSEILHTATGKSHSLLAEGHCRTLIRNRAK